MFYLYIYKCKHLLKIYINVYMWSTSLLGQNNFIIQVNLLKASPNKLFSPDDDDIERM